MTTLSKALELTQQQADKVKEILMMVQSQAKRDRESFQGNSVALYQAALQRRRISDSCIEDLLKEDQLDQYAGYKERRAGEDEVLMWSEGLQLTDDQKEEVESILEEFFMMEGTGAGGKRGGMPPPGGQGPGGMGGGTGGSMRGGRPGGMPGMGGWRGGDEEMVERMTEMIKKREKKKAKEIKKILTAEQKVMWKPLVDFHLSQVEQRVKERLKNRPDRRERW